MVESAFERVPAAIRPEAAHLLGPASGDEWVELAALNGLAKCRPECGAVPIAELGEAQLYGRQASLARAELFGDLLAKKTEIDVHRAKGAHEFIKSFA